MILDDHVSALRDLDGHDTALAFATRLRLRRSLDRDHGVRRRLASVGLALVVLLAATASWALATGELQRLWHRAMRSSAPRWPTPPAEVVHAMAAPIKPAHRTAPAVTVTVTIEPAPPIARPVQHAQLATMTAIPEPPAAPPVSLYERAHELHFHGHDAGAALAAWDAYLAHDPHGALTVEAKYNRALCLVRLGRLAEARDALEPFADGDVEPSGYRRDEARALVDRIGDNDD